MKNQLFCQIAILGLGLGLSTGALAQAPSAAGTPAVHAGPAKASKPDKAANSVSHGDQSWVISAYKGGAEEVRLGQLASSKGNSPAVKEFGQQMVTDHSKGNAELKALADKKGIKLTTKDSQADADFKKLNALSGAQFDKQYVEMMVKGHKSTVAAFKKEAEKGGDPNIKAWAAKVLPTINQHLAMIEKDQSAIGK